MNHDDDGDHDNIRAADAVYNTQQQLQKQKQQFYYNQRTATDPRQCNLVGGAVVLSSSTSTANCRRDEAGENSRSVNAQNENDENIQPAHVTATGRKPPQSIDDDEAKRTSLALVQATTTTAPPTRRGYRPADALRLIM